MLRWCRHVWRRGSGTGTPPTSAPTPGELVAEGDRTPGRSGRQGQRGRGGGPGGQGGGAWSSTRPCTQHPPGCCFHCFVFYMPSACLCCWFFLAGLCCRARLAATQQGQAHLNAQIAQERQQCSEQVELLQVRISQYTYTCMHHCPYYVARMQHAQGMSALACAVEGLKWPYHWQLCLLQWRNSVQLVLQGLPKMIEYLGAVPMLHLPQGRLSRALDTAQQQQQTIKQLQTQLVASSSSSTILQQQVGESASRCRPVADHPAGAAPLSCACFFFGVFDSTRCQAFHMMHKLCGGGAAPGGHSMMRGCPAVPCMHTMQTPWLPSIGICAAAGGAG
jgi:hypothetical protein